jgi:hypothetical protein
MTNVCAILVHAEFPCSRCGGPAVRMAVAPLVNGVIGDAPRPTEQLLCKACEESNHQKELAAYRLWRERRAWVRKNQGENLPSSRPSA